MSANIFGNRLEQARKAAGLSLRALGDIVGLSQTAIQKFEKGQLFPSSDCLIKLAEATHIPIEHLFRPETIQLGKINFRKKSNLRVKSLKEIEYQIKDKLERRLELENCYPSPPVAIFDYQKISDFKITSEVDIETAAIKLRNEWKLGLAPIHDLIDVFENNGIRVIEVDTDDDAFVGMFFSTDNKPVIVIRNNWPGDRQRFTLAHELGHLVFSKSLPSDINEEKACDRFAGAFLFPKSAVQQEFGKVRTFIELRELLLAKQEYGISMAGVLFRLFQATIINESLFRYWQIRFSKEGWRQREPGEQLPSEIPHVFEQMIFHALGEEYISETKAAELMNIDIDSFRRRRLINESNNTDC